MSFDIAKKTFYNAWINSFLKDNNPQVAERMCWDYVNSRKLSMSEIRLEVNITTANAVFAFGLNPQQQNTTNVVFPTERRLQLQDSLVCAEYGIFVGQASGNTDTTWKLNTYGNTQVFAAADAAMLDSVFYSHGSFRVTVNNDVIIPYRGLFNHWYKPQTQQTAALGAGSPGDQIRGAEDGFVTNEPNILLVGSKNYVPEIVLPNNPPSATANLRAVLIFRGVLAQNSTIVN